VGIPWRVLQIHPIPPTKTSPQIGLAQKRFWHLSPIQLGCRFCGWLGWKITSCFPWHLGTLFPFLPFAATNWPHLEKTKTVFCPFSVLSLINYKFANVTKKIQKKKWDGERCKESNENLAHPIAVPS